MDLITKGNLITSTQVVIMINNTINMEEVVVEAVITNSTINNKTIMDQAATHINQVVLHPLCLPTHTTTIKDTHRTSSPMISLLSTTRDMEANTTVVTDMAILQAAIMDTRTTHLRPHSIMALHQLTLTSSNSHRLTVLKTTIMGRHIQHLIITRPEDMVTLVDKTTAMAITI